MVLPTTLDPSGPIDGMIGALYIGMLVSAILYGFCLLQAFLYFQSNFLFSVSRNDLSYIPEYANDPWYTKTAVLTLIIFDAIHLVFIAMSIYNSVISHYHDPSYLQRLTWPMVMQAMFVAANSTIVQVFYIYRAWRLSKGYFYLLCVFLLLLVCGYFGASIIWIVLSMKISTWQELSKISPMCIIVLALSCSIDVLIAGTLCILLNRARTGFKRSDTIINKLIRFVISTGLLTAIFAILSLVCLLAVPYSLIYGGLYLCIGRLYTNSFLTTLNARATITPVDETELKPSSTAQRNINIRIVTTQEAVHDKEQAVYSQKGHY